MDIVSAPERESQRQLMARKRAAERDIRIPEVVDPARRKACLADPLLFNRTYFADTFEHPWTSCQREMIECIVYRAEHGGDQAISGPRGCAKTTCACGTIIYCVFRGLLRFPLILTATGPDSRRILDNIKYAIEMSDLLLEDFPEVCVPIRALEGSPQRGNMQTVAGERTGIEWSADRIVFPRTPGSACGGAIIMARGIDGSIRGLNVFGTRPDFALLDDLDTRESAESPHQTAARERAIDRDVAGLAGPGKKIARVMLCTMPNRTCLAYRYTDPKTKPSFNGKRYRMLVAKPTREDLWEEYMSRRRAAQEAGDRNGLAATEWYAAQQADMDAGAEVSDPLRFVDHELSAIQHCYNIICDRGAEAFLTEYQSDPPEISGPQTSGITDALVRSRWNGQERHIVPDHTLALTSFIDIGDHACHWAVVAWQSGATGCVIDYGVEDVFNQDAGIDKAIVSALSRWRERMLANPYRDREQQARPFDRVLIDTGYRDSAVIQFISQAGGNPFRPSKGFGSGHRQSPFSSAQFNSPHKRIGNHWYEVRQSGGLWLVGMDADYWKRFVHERFLTPAFNEDGTLRRGSLSLWGTKEDSKDHFTFSKHIVSEIEEEIFVPGKGLIRKLKQRSPNNHWLDCLYGNCVAADMCGIQLFTPVPTRAPLKLSDLQARRRAS